MSSDHGSVLVICHERNAVEAPWEWKACELPEGQYYQMLDADGEDVGAILKAFGVNVTPQAYTKGELTGLKSSVSPF